MTDERDMSEPEDRPTPAAARKRVEDRDAKDPAWRERHYRDELTVDDPVPPSDE